MQNVEDICKDYINDVYRYLVCITRNKDIAEELTQETMYKAIKNINNFRGDCKINIWLCKIARNEWFMYVNRQKKVEYIPINEAITMESGIGIEDKLIIDSETNSVYKAIQQLDDETAQIMLLRLENDMDFKEIGKIFNKNHRWARVKFYRGKEKIKEMLKHEQTEETM